MAGPIRGPWRSRPGWSEFGAPRPGSSWGSHQGFDYYCPEGTPIYARGAGRIGGRGFHDGGHGNYVDVAYPGSVVVRASHMQSGSPLAYGNTVDENTVIGYVGKTGNAAGIVWYVGGQALRHLHEEVRVSGRLVDPLGWGVSQAGSGTVTPITPEIEDDMFSDEDRALLLALAKGKDTRELVQTPDGTVWFVVNRILRYGIPREANLNTYKAYLRDLGYSDALVQKSASDISAYGAPVYDGGVLLTALGNDRVAAAVAAALPAGSQPVSTASLAAEFAKLVPTAAENGAAARAAIVK